MKTLKQFVSAVLIATFLITQCGLGWAIPVKQASNLRPTSENSDVAQTIGNTLGRVESAAAGKVLVLELDYANSIAIQHILNSSGYETDTAADIDDVINRAADFDVVVTEWINIGAEPERLIDAITNMDPAKRPDVVIYTVATGEALNRIKEKIKGLKRVYLLPKPASVNELSYMVAWAASSISSAPAAGVGEAAAGGMSGQAQAETGVVEAQEAEVKILAIVRDVESARQQIEQLLKAGYQLPTGGPISLENMRFYELPGEWTQQDIERAAKGTQGVIFDVDGIALGKKLQEALEILGLPFAEVKQGKWKEALNSV